MKSGRGEEALRKASSDSAVRSGVSQLYSPKGPAESDALRPLPHSARQQSGRPQSMALPAAYSLSTCMSDRCAMTPVPVVRLHIGHVGCPEASDTSLGTGTSLDGGGGGTAGHSPTSAQTAGGDSVRFSVPRITAVYSRVMPWHSAKHWSAVLQLAPKALYRQSPKAADSTASRPSALSRN